VVWQKAVAVGKRTSQSNQLTRASTLRLFDSIPLSKGVHASNKDSPIGLLVAIRHQLLNPATLGAAPRVFVDIVHPDGQLTSLSFPKALQQRNLCSIRVSEEKKTELKVFLDTLTPSVLTRIVLPC
jgi:hypothetical protein